MKKYLKRIVALICVISLCVGSVSVSAAPENYSGVLTIANALATSSNSTAFYMEGTDEYKTGSDSWPEVTMMPASDDTESGIFVDGVRIDNYFTAQEGNTSYVRLRKFSDSGNDYYIERIPNVQTGSVVTIKGTFYVYDTWMVEGIYDNTPIVFTESNFQWNGSQWVDYVKPEEPKTFTGVLTIANALATSSNSAAFYMEGTDEYKTGSDSWPELTMMPASDDTESGIFVDGVRIDNYFSAHDGSTEYVRLRKFSDSGNDYYIERIPNVQTGSVVTIKGTFHVYGNWMETDLFDTTPIVFTESNFQWNGSQWVDYVPTTDYNGKLTVEGAQVPTDKLVYIYLKGTDGYLADHGEDWESAAIKLYPDANDENSGVWLNDTKQSAGFLKKYNGQNNYYLVEGFTASQEGDIVTVKGTFQSSDGLATVTYEESKFQWNGTQWVDYVEVANYNGELTVTGAETDNSNSSMIFLKGTDEYLKDNTNAWTGLPEEKLVAEAEDAESGIWLNDTKQTDAFLKKYSGSNNLYLAEGFTTPSKGDVVTIKGTFYSQDGLATVTFTEGVFQWNGSAWKNYVELEYYNGSLKVAGAQVPSTVLNYIYLKGTDAYLAGGGEDWESAACKLYADAADETSGVWLNNTKQASGFLKKYNGGNNYYLVEGFAASQEGDTVTVKGTFYSSDGLAAVTFEESKFQWDGEKWVDYVDISDVEFEEITLKNLHNVTNFRTENNCWKLYIELDGAIPGTIDVTHFENVKVIIDGTTYKMTTAHSHQDTLYLEISGDVVPQFPEKDIEIVIKAGKYLTTDKTEGIHITDDFSIYVNEYGISDKGFIKPYVPAETNVKVSIDYDRGYGGNEAGIYLLTDDKFKVDETWSTLIRGVSYDDESGIFLNGKKIDSILKKYEDGRIYIDLLTAGVLPQDKDEVVIKGTFYLDDYAVSYKEYKLYWNGKQWNTSYVDPTEKYVNITGKEIHKVTNFNAENKIWKVYINVDGTLPGKQDQMRFEGLEIYVDGKKLDTYTQHSHEGTLYFSIPEEYLSRDAADGVAITIKAGKALSSNRIDGINLTKDFTFYTFLGSMTADKPTKNTKYQEIKFEGIPEAQRFNEEGKIWQLFLKTNIELETEHTTQYFKFPVILNGKEIEVTAAKEHAYLYIYLTEDILPGDTKQATLTIKKGATGIANAGKNGIRVTEDFNLYLFDGVWSKDQFDQALTTEIEITGLQNTEYVETTDNANRWNVYLWADTKIPGTSWYEYYEDFTVYYNGREIQTRLCRANSTNGRLLYMSLQDAKVGVVKEGDIITIKPHTATCGGYHLKFTTEFAMQYRDGVWSEYVASDVQEPADNKSLWEIARFDSSYIPLSENGVVSFSSSDKYNSILSQEEMKDYTVSFTSEKLEDDTGTPSVSVVLRGRAIDEETELSTGTLYGYVVQFYMNEEKIDEENSIWIGCVNVWKNGRKDGLIDQYRIAYARDKGNPFFWYNESFEYEFSIYNVTETCVCITVKVNDEVVLRCYDHASDDPMDPAINAGKFGVYAECMSSIYDDVYEVDEVIATKTECNTNEAVWVAGSYPYVMNKTEFSVDKEGAAVTNGVFKATEPGTYTISCTYDGKEIAPKVITVTEAEEEVPVDEQVAETNWLLIGIVAATSVALVAIIVVSLIIHQKRKKKDDK